MPLCLTHVSASGCSALCVTQGVDVTARLLQRRYASVEMSVDGAADLVDRFSGASQEDNPERAIFR